MSNQRYYRSSKISIAFLFRIALLLLSCSQNYASDSFASDDEGSVYALSEEISDQRGDLQTSTQTVLKLPEEYTLMLLDRSRVDWESITEETEPFWPFIVPHIRTMTQRADYFAFKLSTTTSQYWVCKLMRPHRENRVEKFVDSLLLDLPSTNGTQRADTIEPSIFSAAMILFPVEDSPDKVLAYLFGRWPSLLNVDTIVKNFGLRSAVSVDIFCDETDRETSHHPVINQVISEDCRVDDPMNTRLRSRRGLHSFEDFRLNVGDSKIEGIRFKPVKAWGQAYITASDSFQFRLQQPNDAIINLLYTKALKI